MVNRLWGVLIGKPLVDSTSDFGFRTPPPAVPQVLDELAVEFADHWSIKQIVRRIVLTRIYQQSADKTDAAVVADPDNETMGRANRRRRDFESLRDSFLCVADRLDTTIGGPPIEITLSPPPPRRTVYAMIDRQNLPAMFRTFDFAGPDAHSPGRYYTTVPQQALFLMNSPQMTTLARSVAASVRSRAADDYAAIAIEMFATVLRRSPTMQELAMAIEFLSQPASPPPIVIEPRSLWSYGVGPIDDQHRVKSLTPFAAFHRRPLASGQAIAHRTAGRPRLCRSRERPHAAIIRSRHRSPLPRPVRCRRCRLRTGRTSKQRRRDRVQRLDRRPTQVQRDAKRKQPTAAAASRQNQSGRVYRVRGQPRPDGFVRRFLPSRDRAAYRCGRVGRIQQRQRFFGTDRRRRRRSARPRRTACPSVDD